MSVKAKPSIFARIASLRLLVLLGSICLLNSCIPLAIGAAGVAVGYIARDEKFGLSPEAENDSSDVSYSDIPDPSYDSNPINPSYDAAPQFSDDANMPVY